MQQDLHEVYGIDTGDPDLLTSRSWAWLSTRVRGLINHPTRTSRLAAVLAAQPGQGGFDVS